MSVYLMQMTYSLEQVHRKKIRQSPENSFLKPKSVKKQQKLVKLHADVI